MISFNKSVVKLSLVLLCALAISKVNACEFSESESLTKDCREKINSYKTRFQYREDQTLHLAAAVVGCGYYKGISPENLEKYINKLASQHASNFGVVYEMSPISLFSPLSSLYREFFVPWDDEQMQQAAIITKIYSRYESPVPETLSSTGPSLLHSFLSKDYSTYPELLPVRSYLQTLFGEKVPASTDEVFLTYAYIFYHFEVGQEKASSLVKFSQTFDMTPYLERIEAERLDSPYDLLGYFLKGLDAWRLCMDFNRQRDGKNWVNYEQTEQGTIPSLLKGFDFLKRTQSERLSVDYLQRLYDVAFQHSSATPSRGLRYGLALSDTTLSFILDSGKYSHVSELDLIRYGNGFSLKMSMRGLKDLNPLLEGFIKDYYDVIENENASFKDKLVAANELSHVLVITHPHRDGNTRTFTTLLLNKTLMDLGIPPCIFENPNAFDGHTSPEALPLILKGIENFKNVRDGKLPDGMRTTQDFLDLKDERQGKVSFIPSTSKS